MTKVFGNVYATEDLQHGLVEAFGELDEILEAHSGPFAANCVIGSRVRQHNDVDAIVKDGIMIMRHLIVSEDATSRFAARMTRFVGITVDSRCHDGTTTSMLLFCRLARIAIEYMHYHSTDTRRYVWANAISQALKMCSDYLNTVKITEQDLLLLAEDLGVETTPEDVRAAIAYHMAMISSKGDHDLSSKVSELIRSCPQKIYGMFSDTPLAIETDEAYRLRKQPYDLSIKGNLTNVRDYNHKNDTQYLSTNAVIFASGNEIVTSTMESAFLQAFISNDPRLKANLSDFGVDKGWEELCEGRKNLLILTPMLNDDRLMGEIVKFNERFPQARITCFHTQCHGRMRTSLNKTIHYLAGSPLFGDVIINDASRSLVGLDRQITASAIGNVMTLTGLYEKDGHVFHPFYRYPELFEPYTRFAKETEELIDFAYENISNPALDSDEVTYLTMLYRALTCQEIYDIEIGGSAHDQRSNRSVYEDTIGAALSAVKEGVILGGYAQLARYCDILTKLEDGSVWDSLSKEGALVEFSGVFKSVVKSSLRAEGDIAFEQLDGKWSYIAADMKNYDYHNPDNHIKFFKFDKVMLETFLKRVPDQPILLQAYAGYHEQFRRFQDILPRIALSVHLADMRLPEGVDVG